MGLTISLVLYSIVALIAAFIIVSSAHSIKTFLKFRGKRLVRCPENRQHVAVELDAGRAARQAFFGSPYFRLSECSRWPEMKDCGQECLRQIELAPDECLVKNFAARWYQGKKCAYCGKLIHEVDWAGHKPALMSPEKRTVYWDSIPPEKLPEVFSSFAPVCWDCHITETFRRDHPEMVVDRPRH